MPFGDSTPAPGQAPGCGQGSGGNSASFRSKRAARLGPTCQRFLPSVPWGPVNHAPWAAALLSPAVAFEAVRSPGYYLFMSCLCSAFLGHGQTCTCPPLGVTLTSWVTDTPPWCSAGPAWKAHPGLDQKALSGTHVTWPPQRAAFERRATRIEARVGRIVA